jgi:hypothetical protein
MTIVLNQIVQVEGISVARKLVVAALMKDSSKVTSESDLEVSARRGSQVKMRTFGGIFVNLKVLPVRVTVTFVESPDGPQIEIQASDDMGFGTMLGMEAKYLEAVADIVRVVTASVASVAVQHGIALPQLDSQNPQTQQSSGLDRASSSVDALVTVQDDSASAVEPKFCGSCGSPRNSNRFCANCGAQLVG